MNTRANACMQAAPAKELFVFAASVLLLGLCACTGDPKTPQALTGSVTSAEEGRMEGVLVSAKSDHRPITITVVTGNAGSYSFPRDRLQPDSYKVTVRAAGYEVDQPARVTVCQGGTARLDLKLRKTADVSLQLTSAEWLMSIPGSEQDKGTLYRCVACHDLTPIMQSRYDASSWPEAIRRMQTYVPPSLMSSPVKNPEPPAGDVDPGLVRFLSSINLNGRNGWPFELRSFPRPKGAQTRVIITEYDLPGPSLPHDAVVARDGYIYYDDFQRPLVGRLDPRTGEIKEWTLPVLRPGFPEGLLTIKVDKNGDAWIPRFFQGCTLVRMNTRTEQFTSWTVPERFNGKESRCGHVALGAPDGTIWMSDSGGRKMFRFNPASGTFQTFNSFPNYSVAKNTAAIETAGHKSTGHR